MITLLIYFIIAIILFSVAVYVVNTLLPEPFRKFAYIVLVVVGAIFLVYLLLGMVHGGGPLPALR